MNFIGKIVKHKVFGEGKIINSESNLLIIEFKTKVSKFVYPDSFETFLMFIDEDLQKEVESKIIQKKKDIEMAKIQEENLRRQQEEEKERNNLLTANERRLVSMFKADYRVEYLARNPILTYQQVEERFNIKITGFGKGINPTSSRIILISSIDKKNGSFVYHDHWTAEGDYIYSGEGKNGDQYLQKGNLAVANSTRDFKPIHLFVKFSAQEYYYQGVFYLVDYTYEDDIDASGKIRKEYKFRLRKIRGGSI